MAWLTKAADPVRADFRGNRQLQAIVATLVVLWTAAAISPVDRFDWLLENLLVFVVAIAGLATYRRWPLSNLTYLLVAVFLAMHIVGAHYTYAQTPAGFWLQETLGLSRNHYDRIVHFGFGLLVTYPMLELVRRWSGSRRAWSTVTACAIMIAASGLFEIAEWLIAVTVSPDAATTYLGVQGDPFDAEKDMAFAHTGVAVALVATLMAERARRRGAR